MISTECSAKPTQVCSVATKQVSTKPLVIHEYNLSMNGVDKADQYTTYYSFVRKSKKWWRKLFFWLFELAAVNSYILYKITAPRPSTHLEYRRRLADALASRHIMAAPPRHVGRPRKTPLFPSGGDPDRLNKQPHFLGKRQVHDCVVCSDRSSGERHRSKYFCQTCTSHPSLCPDECFKRYHTLDRFTQGR